MIWTIKCNNNGRASIVANSFSSRIYKYNAWLQFKRVYNKIKMTFLPQSEKSFADCISYVTQGISKRQDLRDAISYEYFGSFGLS